ncbi:MAG TPA: hypothetical protein VHT73_09500 [Thermodesulfobacteriota bacterium]|nr:hypothetical protein [Thermodesulfobacteriota bacterium]
MSHPKSKFAKIFLISLAVLFVLLLVSLFVVTEFIVPEKIRNYTEEISRDTGFKIKIKDIEFGLLGGLRGEAIEIYEPPGFADPAITVGKVIAKPEILSSLINWKIKIRIAIDKSIFSLSRDELYKFTKLIEERQRAEEEHFPIEIVYVEISDGSIRNPFGDPVLVKKMEVELEYTDSIKERTVNIAGLMSFRNNNLKVRGRVKPFLDTPFGDLQINAPRVNAEFLPDADNFPNELTISSDFLFLVGDKITSQGVINFRPAGDGNGRDYLSGMAQYDIAYNRSDDTVFVQSAIINMDKLLQVSLAGRIEDIRTERLFDLKGVVDNIKLKNISELLDGVSPVQFSGDVKPIQLKVIGSEEDRNVSLNGKIILSGVDIKGEKDGFQVNELQGEFDFNKTFHGGVLDELSAQGNFSSPSMRTEIGELNKVSGKIEFAAADSEDKTLTVSSIKASFLDGTIFGDARFKTLNGEKSLEGKLRGQGINLEEIPKNYVPVVLGGSLETIKAEFTSKGLEEFSSDLSFSLRDLRLKLGEKEIIELSGAKTTDSFKVQFASDKVGEGNRHLNESQNGDSGGTSSQSRNRLTVEGEGLYLEGLLYSGLILQRANVNELLFKLGENNRWALDLSGSGSRFRMPDSEISLNQFRTEIHSEKEEQLSVSGSISGTDGEFRGTSFPHLSSEFSYKGDLLKLTDLRTQISDYGQLEIGEIKVRFEEQENGVPYTIAFSGGSFSGFDQKIKSEGIRGELLFYNGREKPHLKGSVFINETDISESRLTNASLRISLMGDKINLENISGEILGGDLKGNVLISNLQTSRLVSFDFEFTNLSVPYGDVPVSLGSLSFNFSGKLGGDSFPQGSGKVSFADMKVGRDGTSPPLKGQTDIRTIHETLLLENGFIQGSGEERINFFIRVENVLNQGRNFYVDLPEVPLATAQEILSPALPGFLQDSDIRGNASLELTMHRFLQQDISWSGRLYIADATLITNLSGTPFSVKNVNGAIVIKNKTVTGKTLVHFIEKGWKLERESFKAFLNTISKDGAKEERDELLEIQEIEYGFLRLTNIECVVKLDRDKVNLKRLRSNLYDGAVFSRGFFDFGESREYNFSVLFNDISLDRVTESLSIKDYITGRLNGLLWLRGKQGRLGTLDGSFNFWTVESKKEPRRIGKAFLEKLGVREQFFLGSSRKYDRGEIYGYVLDGVITFKQLHISNTILGIRDLLIQVDKKRNSISVAHLLSVIRETARRSAEGGVKIEFEK